MKIKLISETPPARNACGPSITDETYETFIAGQVVDFPKSLALTLIEIGAAVEVEDGDGV